MDLKNAAVLVTGGSCGIGLETARLLRNRGARVAICARHQSMLEAAAKEIGALPIVADVSKEDDVLRMISTVVKEYSDYNVLINKIVAERLSDKLQIMMVPSDGKFFFANDVLRSMNVANHSSQAEQPEDPQDK